MSDDREPPPDARLDRFISLVRQELGTSDAWIELDAAPPPLGYQQHRHRLGDGRSVVVTYKAAQADDEEARERLEMLFSCFEETLESLAESRLRGARPPPLQILHEELRALAHRAGALDALIIDGTTPVVWCAASVGPAVDGAGRPLSREAGIEALRMKGLRLVEPSEEAEPPPGGDVPPLPELSRKAIVAVRRLPAISSLSAGGRLRHFSHDDALGVAAESVGDIYVAILVFDGSFEELRAERALRPSLHRIEGLLPGLPPLDPTPDDGRKVISLASRRK